MKNFLLLLLALIVLANPALAQLSLPFGFQKSYDIPVSDSLGNNLAYPWAGGLNACHFGAVDLDDDGIRDLVVFDRYGNRSLTYKNMGIAGEISYQPAPELNEQLPKLYDWLIFADYNMDGLNDIFTFSKGYAGILVYRNTGNPEARFQRVIYPYLKSFQGNGYVNILVTYSDYPAIKDMDGDGDLDILTFWGLGAFIEFHKNESMELYGNPDSLIFRKTEDCWGRFAESEESNLIFMDTCFGVKDAMEKGDPKHTGSTFMIFDNNGDGLPDLLLGDVDYASPALLINGGTTDEALMVSHSFSFPDYDQPINLLSFPVMSFLDINNDDTKDMIVSPFDPSLVKSKNYNSVWLYQNNGGTNNPDFERINTAFLQEDMVDFGAGAYPAFFDHNQDGLMDIVVGNFGYLDSSYYGTGQNLYCDYRAQLALLENIGTASQPTFKLITRNYANLPEALIQNKKPFGVVPTFADLDGDNDPDMLVGNSEGNLLYFENTATAGQAADFQISLRNYQNIDIGFYSTPQLFDLDKDGLTDLIIGKRNGTIAWYQNTGNLTDPVFALITDSLGSVDVRNPNLTIFGYCVPHFYRDKNDVTHLFAGSEFGEIYYYDNIDNNLDGSFNLVMKNYLWIDEGLRSAIAIDDLDGDEYPDMLVGNYSGGLNYYKGNIPPPAGISAKPGYEPDIRIFPNPANDFITIATPENSNITLTDARILDFWGKEKRITFDRSNRIFTGDLPEGIYLLQLRLDTPNGKQNSGFKIIIQH